MVDLNLLYEAILGGKLEQSVEVTNQAIAEGVEPQAIINGYMIKAMEEVGQRFQRGEAPADGSPCDERVAGYSKTAHEGRCVYLFG